MEISHRKTHTAIRVNKNTDDESERFFLCDLQFTDRDETFRLLKDLISHNTKLSGL